MLPNSDPQPRMMTGAARAVAEQGAAPLHAQVVRELEHRIELEALIASISTRFVSAHPDNIAAEVGDALGQVGRFIGCDRALMYRFSPDRSVARLEHDWGHGADSAIAEIRHDDAPEVINYFLAKNSLNSPRPETLPPGFAQLNELPGVERVQSRISVPVVQGSDAVGILCFHSIRIERHWREEDLRLLGMLGEIIGSALARAATEIALTRAKEGAEAANRAKSEFLASMSHELRTPLNGILGYAQLLRRRPFQPEDVESIRAIERCGEHLLTLINDVLDLAKIESGRHELRATPFALGELLQEIADVARIRASQSGLEFVHETCGELPTLVVADPRNLRQILLNLLGNAVKFTARGRVTLRVSGTPRGEALFGLHIEVEDSGCGIAEEDLQRAFEPFQQIRNPERRVEGTGLGLSISRRLIELMGGTLTVMSRVGEGSVFTAEIDVRSVASAAQDNVEASSQIVGYSGARRSALIVDDTEDNRRILKALLASIGFDVREAVDGVEAVAAVSAAPPDIVFMDLVMPRQSGFEATRQIRQLSATCASLPIVAVSADAFESTRRESEAAGCSAFITKPVHLDTVLAAMEAQLQVEWIRAADLPAHQPRAEPARAELDRVDLPGDIAEELLHLARMGDVRTLARRVEDLPALDQRLQGLSEKLAGYIRQYDLKSVRELLSAAWSTD